MSQPNNSDKEEPCLPLQVLVGAIDEKIHVDKLEIGLSAQQIKHLGLEKLYYSGICGCSESEKRDFGQVRVADEANEKNYVIASSYNSWGNLGQPISRIRMSKDTADSLKIEKPGACVIITKVYR